MDRFLNSDGYGAAQTAVPAQGRRNTEVGKRVRLLMADDAAPLPTPMGGVSQGRLLRPEVLQAGIAVST